MYIYIYRPSYQPPMGTFSSFTEAHGMWPTQCRGQGAAQLAILATTAPGGEMAPQKRVAISETSGWVFEGFFNLGW